MKAEAYAALNNTTEAVNYLNKVRVRAGNGDYKGPTAKAALEKRFWTSVGENCILKTNAGMTWYDSTREAL
jgi:hypothetical protein